MVAIVARANVAVVPAGGGAFRITKTGGFDEAFDAAAVSTLGFAGDFVLRGARVGGTDRLMIGVSAEPDADTGYMGIDYSLSWRGGVFEIFERGDYRAYSDNVGSFVWIDRIGTTVTYRAGPKRRTAQVVRQVAGEGRRLFFDASLVTPGSAVVVRFDAPGGWSEGRAPGALRTRIGVGF